MGLAELQPGRVLLRRMMKPETMGSDQVLLRELNVGRASLPPPGGRLSNKTRVGLAQRVERLYSFLWTQMCKNRKL